MGFKVSHPARMIPRAHCPSLVTEGKRSTLVASPRYQVHPELESGLFDPDSVDLAGHRGVGAPAFGSVLGRRAIAQR